MKILVTGAAGFIGGNLIRVLKNNNLEFIGIDSFTDYYSAEMKQKRLHSFGLTDMVKPIDTTNTYEIERLFADYKPNVVVHLAAQGGVRASRKNPFPYMASNQIGFLNVLRAAEAEGVQKVIYASSSSVYGDSVIAPYKESAELPAPKSLYALSKISNEIVANHFPGDGITRVGLRFFTVYGPWGRPDMAMFRLLASCKLQKNFHLTAKLGTLRDFTFVDDASRVILEIIQNPKSHHSNSVLNVAGGNPYSLSELITVLNNLNYFPSLENHAPDKLDVEKTHGSTEQISKLNLTIPNTSLIDGVKKTISWLENQSDEDIRTWYESSF